VLRLAPGRAQALRTKKPRRCARVRATSPPGASRGAAVSQNVHANFEIDDSLMESLVG